MQLLSYYSYYHHNYHHHYTCTCGRQSKPWSDSRWGCWRPSVSSCLGYHCRCHHPKVCEAALEDALVKFVIS